MDKYSFLSNSNISYLEDQYKAYVQNPESVEFGWQKFFEGFEFARKDFEGTEDVPESMHKEFKVLQLINGYRSRGHLFTKTNPVRERRKYTPTLDISNFGLDENDLDTVFEAGADCGIGASSLRNIIDHLEKCYCQSIGVEFMYMRNPEVLEWFINRMHENHNLAKFNQDQKKHILYKLTQAVGFEQFLHTRFPGQKRFSLEGAESLIPALDEVIRKAGKEGIEEVVMGMAHRGRLNVLANVFQKTYKEIFSEFEPKDYKDENLDGDVKYHLGHTCDYEIENGKTVHLTLSPNPSHLDAVDPVVEGISRAFIDQQYNNELVKVLPILIHGDAAIAGQGVVYEVIQMASLEGYKTGGTIHIVINNQVGFTTNYIDARSSTYCTDVGKVTLSPVFHVNGDDPEALIHTIQIALDYRNKYNKDVFIDLLCYRKYGHNEGDEPKFTQPLLYKAIAKHPNPRDIYLNQLIEESSINEAEGKKMQEEFKFLLEVKFDESKGVKTADIDPFLDEDWKEIKRSKSSDFDVSPNTSVSIKNLKKYTQKLTHTPKGKKFFRKLQKILDDRKKMVETDALDWGMAEMLAYASLVDEGHPIRFSGQDSERGTFSHRHAIVKFEDSEEEYIHLQNISDNQAKYHIYNSHLSEYAVLGFEYGYSIATPNSLTIWEAQFGDFVNGAQIVIDQFISSAEDKWRSMSGIVLLLPHGYEGMGPEHSSARMERFLTQCAEYNMQVVNCTTPANFFHVLRRQLKRNIRKPLIVFTPKSLLRHPKCISKLAELSKGKFEEVIDDITGNTKKVKKVVLCQGKIFYDLLAKKEKDNIEEVALVRIEQLYPLPEKKIHSVISKYKGVNEVVWVQEEPRNMGALPYMLLNSNIPNLKTISRPASASPASGSPTRAENRQLEIIESVFKEFGKKVLA